MDKYLNNINTSGSNHQRYKRCIYNIIKDVNENITIFIQMSQLPRKIKNKLLRK